MSSMPPKEAKVPNQNLKVMGENLLSRNGPKVCILTDPKMAKWGSILSVVVPLFSGPCLIPQCRRGGVVSCFLHTHSVPATTLEPTQQGRVVEKALHLGCSLQNPLPISTLPFALLAGVVCIAFGLGCLFVSLRCPTCRGANAPEKAILDAELWVSKKEKSLGRSQSSPQGLPLH